MGPLTFLFDFDAMPRLRSEISKKDLQGAAPGLTPLALSRLPADLRERLTAGVDLNAKGEFQLLDAKGLIPPQNTPGLLGPNGRPAQRRMGMEEVQHRWETEWAKMSATQRWDAVPLNTLPPSTRVKMLMSA